MSNEPNTRPLPQPSELVMLTIHSSKVVKYASEHGITQVEALIILSKYKRKFKSDGGSWDCFEVLG